MEIEMYLDLLKTNIQENYNRGYEAVFDGVKAWLESRGVRPSVEGFNEIQVTDRKSQIDT